MDTPQIAISYIVSLMQYDESVVVGLAALEIDNDKLGHQILTILNSTTLNEVTCRPILEVTKLHNSKVLTFLAIVIFLSSYLQY